MFVMDYKTEYGEKGKIKLDAVTESEAWNEAERLADERRDIEEYGVIERKPKAKSRKTK